MGKADNNGKELVKDIKKLEKKRFWQPFTDVVHGMWIFAEGVSLLVTSLFAIYQAHYSELPTWGAYGLYVAGAFVLVPAALVLAKFFRKVAQ